jgi:hypothetical protein
MRNCTVLLDGKAVVHEGRLTPELTIEQAEPKAL